MWYYLNNIQTLATLNDWHLKLYNGDSTGLIDSECYLRLGHVKLVISLECGMAPLYVCDLSDLKSFSAALQYLWYPSHDF